MAKLDIHSCPTCGRKYLDATVANRCKELCPIFSTAISYVKTLIKPKAEYWCEELHKLLSLIKEHNGLTQDPFLIGVYSDYYLTVSVVSIPEVNIEEALLWNHIRFTLESLATGIEEASDKNILFLDIYIVETIISVLTMLLNRS